MPTDKTQDMHTAIFLPVNADLASPSSLNCICPFRASSDNDDMVYDPYVAACMIVDNNSSVCTISLLVDNCSLVEDDMMFVYR